MCDASADTGTMLTVTEDCQYSCFHHQIQRGEDIGGFLQERKLKRQGRRRLDRWNYDRPDRLSMKWSVRIIRRLINTGFGRTAFLYSRYNENSFLN